MSGRAVAGRRASGPPRRPKLAVWKFASCDGCQLSLLDCEAELLAVTELVEIARFPEASRAVVAGPYDLSLVEGSVTTADDVARIRRIRAASRTLVTIGACATAGGIQALRNWRYLGELASSTYPEPELLDVLERSTPIAAHVLVDHELRGCPIDRGQLLELVSAILHGRLPDLPTETVCLECKRRGHVCVAVADGTPCLGPVTAGGCGALCPACRRGCYGCFGPVEGASTSPLADHLAAGGMARIDLLRSFRSFTAGAPAFAEEAARHDAPRVG